MVAVRRFAAAPGLLVAVLLLFLAYPADAWAHASLVSTTPRDGEIVDTAPAMYALTFNEPVSPLALQLVKPDGSPIELDRFAVRDNTVNIDAPALLGQGTHVLSWRVVSQDGHPVAGSVLFSIGTASAAPALAAVDWTVRTGLWLCKIGLYVGLLMGIGGVLARSLLLPSSGHASRIILPALALGFIATALSLGFQGLDALGVPIGRIADPAVLSAGLGTSYGGTVLAALLAFLLAGASFLVTGGVATAMAALALLVGAGSLALSGHASAAEPQWLTRPMVFAHVAAAACWTGALAPLGLALRARDPLGGAALRRFSQSILPIVVLLVVAGVTLAVVQVQRPGELLRTDYGNVLLVKLALLAGLFLLAAVNRWTLTAAAMAGNSSASYRLVRSIFVEAALVVAILGVVAVWRFTPPPRVLLAVEAQPATEHIHTDKAMAQISILPGRAGEATVSADLLTGDFAPLDAKEVTIVFSKPDAGIEPFRRSLQRIDAGGNWQADGVTIPLPGLWHVRIDVLINDFDMVRLDGQVSIRP